MPYNYLNCTTQEWISLNIQQNFNGRNDNFLVINAARYKVGIVITYLWKEDPQCALLKGGLTPLTNYILTIKVSIMHDNRPITSDNYKWFFCTLWKESITSSISAHSGLPVRDSLIIAHFVGHQDLANFIVKNSAKNSIFTSIFNSRASNSTLIHQFYYLALTRLRLQRFGIRLDD